MVAFEEAGKNMEDCHVRIEYFRARIESNKN